MSELRSHGLTVTPERDMPGDMLGNVPDPPPLWLTVEQSRPYGSATLLILTFRTQENLDVVANRYQGLGCPTRE